ncbi:MAG TPA: hypothetical protein PK854_12225 [Oscillospiraceae bacterium]|nr:hypothetical protein [Oscillospiraceae bacterium]HPS36016.1 hypothetical protein [Oscillospiraceae bacterium]
MRRFIPVLLLVILFAVTGCSKSPVSSQISSQASSQPSSSDASVLVDVYDTDALMQAIDGNTAAGVKIKADITIGLSSLKEFEKSSFVMVIDKGVTVTMGDNFAPAISGIVNNGTLLITGTFEFAFAVFENNGTIRIADKGMLAPYHGTIQNNGEVLIDAGGELRLDRVTTFNNAATVTNNGTLKITNDGGVFHNLAAGTLTNNKTIACVGIYTNEGKFIGEGEPLQ